jgi:hypothetical protein
MVSNTIYQCFGIVLCLLAVGFGVFGLSLMPSYPGIATCMISSLMISILLTESEVSRIRMEKKVGVVNWVLALEVFSITLCIFSIYYFLFSMWDMWMNLLGEWYIQIPRFVFSGISAIGFFVLSKHAKQNMIKVRSD